MQERNRSKQPAKEMVAEHPNPRKIALERSSDGTSQMVATKGLRFPRGGVSWVLCGLPVLESVDHCHDETQSAIWTVGTVSLVLQGVTSPPAETAARLLWYETRLRERSSRPGVPTPNFGDQHSLAANGTVRLAGRQGRYIQLEAARTER